MKFTLSTIFAIFGFSALSLAQNSTINLTGVLGDSLRNISNRYMLDTQIELKMKCAVFIYILKKHDETECFFGLIATSSQLEHHIPSYYFYNNNKIVFVYTGAEEYMTFSDGHIREIKEIGIKTFYPEDFGLMIHYLPWFCNFKNDKMKSLMTTISKKRNAELTKLMMRNYK